MNSVARFMYWGTIPLGSAIGGVVAQSIGLRPTLFAAAAGAAVAGIPIALSPIRTLRRPARAAAGARDLRRAADPRYRRGGCLSCPRWRRGGAH